MAEALRVGIAGLGTVGASVVRVLGDKAAELTASAAATSSLQLSPPAIRSATAVSTLARRLGSTTP
ncbi:hypothetical protein AJ88_34545 [Mesorhizobium amorphae CCBAU 01583]|nr:hypothetical protein AJ88_34545 [Mesorhizobium amorphae CCBAU 01583]